MNVFFLLFYLFWIQRKYKFFLSLLFSYKCSCFPLSTFELISVHKTCRIPRWSSLKVCSLILFVRQLVKGYKIQGFIIIHIISVLSKQELEIESQSYYTFHYHLGWTHKCIFVHMCFGKNIKLCFTCFTFSVHYT